MIILRTRGWLLRIVTSKINSAGTHLSSSFNLESSRKITYGRVRCFGRHQEYDAFGERETMIQDIAHLREKVCAASHHPLFFVVDISGHFPDFVIWFAATGDVGPEQFNGLHCSYRGSNLPLNALLLIGCATLVLTKRLLSESWSGVGTTNGRASPKGRRILPQRPLRMSIETAN